MHSSSSQLIQNLKHLRRVKIGIRAEDPKRIWERRAPLTPDAVSNLTHSGRAKVEVVSSPKRIFTDKEYIQAGATIVPSLSDSDIVLGIKEPPLTEIAALRASPNASRQTHIMFSHTIKGQPYNTPLLANYVIPSNGTENRNYPRLVDYELITNELDGKRTVGFGWFAGVAGVLEALSSMAHSHLQLGSASPFLYTPRPHTLPSLANLRAALHDIGTLIAEHGTPSELGPFIFGLTGNGQVSQGCLSILAELPIQMVKVEELDSLMLRWKSSEVDLRKIYLVHAKPEEYLVRLDGGKYDRAHYYQSPQSYTSVFAEKVAPYLTLFLNGTGWSPSFPRLMTNDQLEVALARARVLGGARFTNIGDISCDVKGGLEFLNKATTLSSPSYEERPQGLPAELPSVQMMAVDILPASIPLDASIHFSSALEGHLSDLVDYHSQERHDFPPTLERATIASLGILKGPHQWLQPAVDKHSAQLNESSRIRPVRPSNTSSSSSWGTSSSRKKKRILILGSGMVAGPAVDLIAQNPSVDLVIASDSGLELQRLVGPHSTVKYRIIDAGREATYAHLVKDADVVISLLPASMHAAVAKVCLHENSHLITASYMSEDISRLNKTAQTKGLLFLTEIGLDPGIDHCSAMDMLHRFAKDKQAVTSFISFCGGLPSPEDSNVPLRYKFSWRPQGVLTAALNDALYLLDNEVHNIPGNKLLKSYFPNVPITHRFNLEGLPNRDSLAYKSLYRTPFDDKSVKPKTFLRGTLRYPGFSSLMNSFAALGLLNTSHTIKLDSWHKFVEEALNIRRAEGVDTSLSSLIGPEEVEPLRDALEWLGLAQPSMLNPPIGEDNGPMPLVPQGPLTPLDLFAFLLSQKLKYAPNERDMVVLSHEIITKQSIPSSANWKTAVHTSTLIVKGTTEHGVGYVGQRPASAMARTVGLPVAIAAMLVAEGRIKGAGVMRPTERHIFMPILDGLNRVGIFMKEKTVMKEKMMNGERTVEDTLIWRHKAGTPVRGLRDQQVIPERDLDGDRTWKEDEGLVVNPSSQF